MLRHLGVSVCLLTVAGTLLVVFQSAVLQLMLGVGPGVVDERAVSDHDIVALRVRFDGIELSAQPQKASLRGSNFTDHAVMRDRLERNCF
jgi:hypothetical protein